MDPGEFLAQDSEEEQPESPLPEKSPEIPDDDNVSAGAKKTYSSFEKQARAEGKRVHSYDSLESSRNHMKWLFDAVPEHKQIEIATKIADQEIGLQESIRRQSYSDSELSGRLRRFLVIVVLLAFVFFLLLLFLISAGSAIWGWKVDKTLYSTVADMTKWAFGGAVAAFITYFFPKAS